MLHDLERYLTHPLLPPRYRLNFEYAGRLVTPIFVFLTEESYHKTHLPHPSGSKKVAFLHLRAKQSDDLLVNRAQIQ